MQLKVDWSEIERAARRMAYVSRVSQIDSERVGMMVRCLRTMFVGLIVFDELDFVEWR